MSSERERAMELVEEHADGVFAACLALLGDPDLARDVAQDALLKGIGRLHGIRRVRSMRAWLISIARNLCRDRWKTTRRRRELLTTHTAEIAEVSSGVGPAPADESPDPHASLHAALSRLPESHRLPLLLFYFEGRSTQRVAEALDITPAAACTRLCRARKALREILEADDE